MVARKRALGCQAPGEHTCSGAAMKRVDDCTVVDVFCGAGGLTHGFVLEGFDVAAGIDVDPACRYPFEKNNPGAKFVEAKVEDLDPTDVSAFYPEGHVKILVGCAPCRPFSSYTRDGERHEERDLLYTFAGLIEAIRPDIVSMENVPRLTTYEGGRVYRDFCETLRLCGYESSPYPRVYAPDYGVPQRRTRLVLFASRWGEIRLLRRSHTPRRYRTVRDAIGDLPPIEAGGVHPDDPLHRASRLSELNMKRIRASVPGGTWLDWDEELRAACHVQESGKWYKSVYGRMTWDDPAPTITTQCYGFGNGRFGHPEQDRAISLREAALLQSFPRDYEFFDPDGGCRIRVVGRLIGNAVPVTLARAIAKSIRLHILSHRGWLWRSREGEG